MNWIKNEKINNLRRFMNSFKDKLIENEIYRQGVLDTLEFVYSKHSFLEQYIDKKQRLRK